MKLWLSIIGVLLVQEFVSTNAVLLIAFQRHYSVWIIHLIFVLATLLTLSVGYLLGKFVQRRFGGNRLVSFIRKHIGRFEEMLGHSGKRVALLWLGFFSPVPVYFNAFAAAWLDISFGEVLVLLFLGDILWYALVWMLVLGVNSFAGSSVSALYIILSISVAASILFRYFRRGRSMRLK